MDFKIFLLKDEATKRNVSLHFFAWDLNSGFMSPNLLDYVNDVISKLDLNLKFLQVFSFIV